MAGPHGYYCAGVKREVQRVRLALVAVAALLCGCASDERPTVAGSEAPSSVVMVTRAPDEGDRSATTTVGAGPFETASGLLVDVDDPCRVLSTAVLELLGAITSPASPLADPRTCRVELAAGVAEAVVSPYDITDRKSTFEAYTAEHEPEPLQPLQPGSVPAVYFAGGDGAAQPELALFPDNGIVVLRLPEAPPDTTARGLSQLVTAIETTLTAS